MEQQDLLEGLAHSEENYFLVRKTAKLHRMEYLAKCEELGSILRMRIDRPDPDSEDGPLCLPLPLLLPLSLSLFLALSLSLVRSLSRALSPSLSLSQISSPRPS